MSKISFLLSVCFTLSLCAHQAAAARMVAKRVSAHQHVKAAGLSEKQKQLRKASEQAEASMVCRKPDVKNTINADLSVDGVTDINWDTVMATANDGMKQIEGDIDASTTEIARLDKRIDELEAMGKWNDLGASDMNEMLYAACTSFQQEGQSTGDCSWAVEGNCGWEDPALMDAFIEPPFDEPIQKFTEVAASKITGFNRLSVAAFRKQCSSVLSADMCGDLCLEFTEVVRGLHKADSAKTLGTEDLDELKAQRAAESQKLADFNAEKESCAQAHTQLEAFRAQLGKLSGNYKDAAKAVGRYKRTLRMQSMRLRRQIMILKQKKALLERAKQVFAAASQQVIERQADVDHMQAIVDDLIKQLEAQRILLEEIAQKIKEIDEATKTGRLIKSELSRIVSNAHDTQVQSIHKPLEGLKITLDRNIAQDFDTAEADAAPAMKTTVQAVAAYCSTEDVTTALTSPLVKIEGQSKALNFICVGLDWNNMIAEAQKTVKDASKQVVDLLVAEQEGVKSDIHVPVPASQALREANGEPKGLRHAVATFGGQGGSFFDGYLNPGWTVDVTDGAVGTVGKMLQLYQKLGEAAEEMQQQWDVAKAHEAVLLQKKKEAVAELERLTEKLIQAIKARDIAKEMMDEAQKVVDENQALKDQMQDQVDKSTETLAEGEKAQEEVKDALLKEHTERAAALLQILQELKK
jgi:hypothetical protein